MFYRLVRRNFVDSSTQLHWFVQTSSSLVRFITNISKPNLTLDYLINSCDLSLESALKASKNLNLEATTGPDTVLSLFKTHGFTKSQISNLITRCPSLLISNPDKTIKPKLEFFSSIGISGPNLADLLIRDSSIWKRSLEKKIIPSIDALKSLVDTDDAVHLILKRSTSLLHNSPSSLKPIFSILQNHQVPKSHILKLLMNTHSNLTASANEFNKVVVEINKMGVPFSSLAFVRCLHVRLVMKKALWDAKMEVFRSFGWSDDEVLSVFKREPFMMASSTKKIRLSLDFFMNKLNWGRDDIAKSPCLLRLSLEKRTIPRWFVVQILLSNDLINKDAIANALRVTEDMFLTKYVTKYQQVVPDLFMLYQSKMSSQGVKTRYKDGCQIELLSNEA